MKKKAINPKLKKSLLNVLDELTLARTFCANFIAAQKENIIDNNRYSDAAEGVVEMNVQTREMTLDFMDTLSTMEKRLSDIDEALDLVANEYGYNIIQDLK